MASDWTHATRHVASGLAITLRRENEALAFWFCHSVETAAPLYGDVYICSPGLGVSVRVHACLGGPETSLFSVRAHAYTRVRALKHTRSLTHTATVQAYTHIHIHTHTHTHTYTHTHTRTRTRTHTHTHTHTLKCL